MIPWMAELVYEALYFIFPAYCANAAPVIFGGGASIDGGKTFRDGRPIFGPRKTFRGFFAGLTVGTLVGFIMGNIALGFMLSLGALIGDLFESFLKRRMGRPPGASFPVADQLDFVAGALLFSLLVSKPPTLPVALTIIIITPPIHLSTNFFAYLLGMKKEPW
jgi:CDP-2,3-bis-(O-geranylgeranyl)-sn-glycerol synthase